MKGRFALSLALLTMIDNVEGQKVLVPSECLRKKSRPDLSEIVDESDAEFDVTQFLAENLL